jgi:hypothetical protein
MAAIRVERVELGDPAELALRLEREALPLVICGAARGWPALERWAPERLAERLGFGERPGSRCSRAAGRVSVSSSSG